MSLIAWAGWESTVIAQPPVVMTVGPDGQPMAVQAGQAFGPGGQPPGQPGEAQPGGKPGKPGDASKEKKEEGKEESPDPKVIRRDATEAGEGNPEELKATVGDDGKVAFQFRNQGWVELVQWLAEISDQPLDWLELPGDRVNMRSPGRYTVEETRDLFNRHLLARGYTLLEVDGGLTVAKTESINPAVVPRVESDQLNRLQPHTFVRTSLDVGWLSAEKLAAELAPMISSNGKLTALTTTNRIEAMDAAINLRQVADLLQQEISDESKEALVPQFQLRYLPAEEAKKMLEQFLGIEKKSQAPMTPQQMQMMQQMRQQNPNSMAGAKPKTEISIVANTRQNSVIIRAPPDRVAAAMQFLKQVDVPSDSMMSLSDIQTRVQVFRLASLDPEKLIEIVSEMNILEPSTRVRVDSDNNALIVSGSAADRFIIDSLIKRLDGTGRRFEVLPLRRLDPVEVAESITFLMGQKSDDDDQSRRRNFFYGFYGGQQDKKKPKDEFRVAANSRYRQVLLWANEQEMAEVQSLLVKLGELPPPGGSARTLRVIDASATPETYEYLRRLQQQWNRLSPNQLELPEREQFKEPNERPFESTDESDEPAEEKQTDRKLKDGTLASQQSDSPFRFTAAQEAAAENAETTESNAGPKPSANGQVDAGGNTAKDPQENGDAPGFPPIQSSQDFDRLFGSGETNQQPSRDPADDRRMSEDDATGNRSAPPSIRIEVDKDGNLMLSSQDTMALDRLENLMLQISPPKRPYTVFHIEHASATWMRLNLEDYFEDEEDDDDDLFGLLFFGFDGPSKNDDNPSGLGKGAKLRFIDDLDTNTLVVNGATNDQLRTIAELIELWDVPEPVNKRKTRFTKLVPISYGKAEQIAGTIKDAYRDLLSSNDKAFAQGGQGGGGPGGGGGGNNQATKSRGGGGSSFQSESGEDGGGTNFSFKGKLSIGIDNVGNTLLVSAEGEPLLDLVVDMIDQLDQAARPQGEVQVVELPGGLSAQGLQNALRPLGVEAEVTPLSGQGNNGRRNGRSNPSPNTPNAPGFPPGQ